MLVRMFTEDVHFAKVTKAADENSKSVEIFDPVTRKNETVSEDSVNRESDLEFVNLSNLSEGDVMFYQTQDTEGTNVWRIGKLMYFTQDGGCVFGTRNGIATNNGRVVAGANIQGIKALRIAKPKQATIDYFNKNMVEALQNK